MGTNSHDVYYGQVVTYNLFTHVYYKSCLTKNILNYVKNGYGAKEFVESFNQYGSKPFKRFAKSIEKLRDDKDRKFNKRCFSKAVNASLHPKKAYTYEKKQKENEKKWKKFLHDADTSNMDWRDFLQKSVELGIEAPSKAAKELLTEFLDGTATSGTRWLNENRDKCLDYMIQPVVQFIYGIVDYTTPIETIIQKELGIKDTVSVLSAEMSTANDEFWCKLYLQDYYGYDISSDRVTFDDVEYQVVSYDFRLFDLQYNIVLESVDGLKTKKYLTAPPPKQGLNVAYYIGNNSGKIKYFARKFAYEEVSYQITDTTIPSKPITYTTFGYRCYVYGYKDKYILSEDTSHTEGSNLAETWDDCFPALLLKTNGKYLVDYRSTAVDMLCNPFIYQVMDKLLKDTNMKGLEKVTDIMQQADTEDSLNTVYFTIGVPFVSKTYKDKDNEKFREPEALSKILYWMFEPTALTIAMHGASSSSIEPGMYRLVGSAQNRVNSVQVNVFQGTSYSKKGEITTLRNFFDEDFKTDFYNYKIQCYPTNRQLYEGHIGNTGSYWHSATGFHYYKIYDIQFQYTGNTTKTTQDDGSVVTNYETAVIVTEYVLKDDGTEWESNLYLRGRQLPADGFQPFLIELDKPLSEYFDESVIHHQRIVQKTIIDTDELFAGGMTLDYNVIRRTPDDPFWKEYEEEGGGERKGKTSGQVQIDYDKLDAERSDFINFDLGHSFYESHPKILSFIATKTGRAILGADPTNTTKIYRYAVTPNYIGWIREELNCPYRRQDPEENTGMNNNTYIASSSEVAMHSTKRIMKYNTFYYYASHFDNFDLGFMELSYYYAPEEQRKSIIKHTREVWEHKFHGLNYGFVSAARFYVNQLSLAKQVDKEHYMMFSLDNIIGQVRVPNGVDIVLTDPLQTDNSFILPLPMHLVKKLGPLEQAQLAQVSFKFVGYWTKTQEIEENPFEGLGPVFGAIAGALAGFVISGGNPLGALVGAVLGAAGGYIMEHTNNPWVKLIIGLAFVFAGSGMFTVAGFSLAAMSAFNVVVFVANCIGVIAGAIQQHFMNEMEELQQAMADFQVTYESAMKDLKKKFDSLGDHLLEVKDLIMLTFQEFWFMCNQAIFNLGLTLSLPGFEDLSEPLYRGVCVGVALENDETINWS